MATPTEKRNAQKKREALNKMSRKDRKVCSKPTRKSVKKCFYVALLTMSLNVMG